MNVLQGRPAVAARPDAIDLVEDPGGHGGPPLQ
jgi:hypothetical protein